MQHQKLASALFVAVLTSTTVNAQDDIIVYGYTIKPAGLGLWYIPPQQYSFGTNTNNPPVNMDPNAPYDPFACMTEAASIKEGTIDAIASWASAQIIFQPDYKTTEYSSILFEKPDGSIYATSPTRGDESGVNQTLSLAPGDLVIGTVHNHPGIYQFIPSVADWQVYDNIPTSHRGSFGSFSEYGIGDDRKLRQYRLFDGFPTSPTPGTDNGCPIL